MTPSPSLTRRAVALGALALGAAALMTAGCATRPDVRTDQEPGSDLTAYRSFAFYEPVQSGYHSLLESHLRRATREQLERHQLRYDDRAPDLLVNYALQVLDKQELQSTVRGGVRYRGWSAESLETVDVRQGTLLIDLVDARRQALVWRAVAEGRLDSQALKQPAATIDAVVGEMFMRFPTGGKS
jgi:hypothetical protein